MIIRLCHAAAVIAATMLSLAQAAEPAGSAALPVQSEPAFGAATYSLQSSDPPGSVEQQLAELQAEVQQLRQSQYRSQQLIYRSQPVPATGGCGASCGSGCGCLPTTADEPAVLFGQVEVPFLRPSVSGILPVFNLANNSGRQIDSSFEPSLRYTLEYRPEPTLGVRGRYFSFDQEQPFVDPFRPAELGIQLDVADAEFVFRETSGRFSVEVSGGVQYGRLEYSAAVAGATGVGTLDFEGVGPVLGLGATHQLGQSPFELFGSLRASYLMGNINNASLLVNVPRAEIKDEIMQVYYNQLGISWHRELSERIGLKVTAAWETQFWLNDTFADDVLGIGSNLALTGPAVSAELSY